MKETTTATHTILLLLFTHRVSSAKISVIFQTDSKLLISWVITDMVTSGEQYGKKQKHGMYSD